MNSYLAVITAALLVSCATTTGDPERDARGRAINQTLVEASRVIGRIAVSALLTAAQNEAQGKDADYMQSAVQGMYANMDLATSHQAVKNIIAAYSAGNAPKTAAIAASIAEQGSLRSKEPSKVNEAIAEVMAVAATQPNP